MQGSKNDKGPNYLNLKVIDEQNDDCCSLSRGISYIIAATILGSPIVPLGVMHEVEILEARQLESAKQVAANLQQRVPLRSCDQNVTVMILSVGKRLVYSISTVVDIIKS